MSDPGQELAKSAAKELLAPVRNVLEKITGPLATEVGLTFGDAARMCRFSVKLFEKVKKMAASARVELRTPTPRKP